jgi:hypothetical protein
VTPAISKPVTRAFLVADLFDLITEGPALAGQLVLVGLAGIPDRA